jgi:SNF2 family DNA or RNA helicase
MAIRQQQRQDGVEQSRARAKVGALTQREHDSWFTGGLLCDDMGLGKTVQTLTNAFVRPKCLISHLEGLSQSVLCFELML